MPLKVQVSEYPHIEGLALADEFDDQGSDAIDILIGSDFYWSFITGDTIRGDHGPTAVSSKLGWLLSGPVKTNSADRFTTSNLIIFGQAANCSVIGDDDLKSTLKQFGETESIGIREPEDPSVTQLSDSFLKNIKYEGNRYEVSLPWKEETDCNLLDVPTDYNYCYNRLKSLQHKLRKEPELLEGYNNTINDQFKMGVIEEVPRGKK